MRRKTKGITEERRKARPKKARKACPPVAKMTYSIYAVGMKILVGTG
jgi:hypothetical protein